MDKIELPENLIYVSDAQPGISRRKQGRGFSYFNRNGEHIGDEKIIKRIKELVIPPAWKEVWICSVKNGYLQATGRDLKARKQYRYHPDWEAFSTQNKYSHLLKFADQLPALRRRYRKDLKRKKWGRDKVLALSVALMDELLLRVGSNYYADRNETYGLTTLRRKHISFEGDRAHLHYTGKKGSDRELDLENQNLSRLLRECSELPGYELLRYEDSHGMQSIDSADFNEYINTQVKGDLHVTAKDFRTWGGTVLCIHHEKKARKAVERNSRKQKDTTLVRLVSKDLGNSVAICRKYYIHPRVLEYCTENADFSPSKSSRKKYSEYPVEEQMVLEILNQ